MAALLSNSDCAPCLRIDERQRGTTAVGGTHRANVCSRPALGFWINTCTVLLAIGPVLAQVGAEAGWTRYRNASGTELDFPRQTFARRAGDTELGTGERFETEDGRAHLSVYAISNDEKRSPTSYLKTHMTDRASNLDYIRVTPNFFVTSKYSGDLILYRRCNFASGKLHCIDLAYPANEKRAWDAPVTRISRSLRPL
jgi:hypothetical protein